VSAPVLSPLNNSTHVPQIQHSPNVDRKLAAISKKKVTSTAPRPAEDVVAAGWISSNSATPTKSTATHPSISQNSMSWTNWTKSRSEQSTSTRVVTSTFSPPTSNSWRVFRSSTRRSRVGRNRRLRALRTRSYLLQPRLTSSLLKRTWGLELNGLELGHKGIECLFARFHLWSCRFPFIFSPLFSFTLPFPCWRE
jgi:hypothetical protein